MSAQATEKANINRKSWRRVNWKTGGSRSGLLLGGPSSLLDVMGGISRKRRHFFFAAASQVGTKGAGGCRVTQEMDPSVCRGDMGTAVVTTGDALTARGIDRERHL